MAAKPGFVGAATVAVLVFVSGVVVVGQNLVAGAGLLTLSAVAFFVSGMLLTPTVAPPAERLKSEAQDHSGQESESGFIDNVGDWVFLVSPAGDVLDTNPAAQEAFTVTDAAQSSLLALTLSRDLSNLVERAAQGDDPAPTEITFNHPRERSGVARIWPVDDDRSQFFVVVRDVTELRRLERARRDFVANVSHEFRTPMATIRAMVETIIDTQEERSAETERYLSKVVSEVERLTNISNDLLTLAAAESTTSTPEALDIAEMVSSCVQQVKPRAVKKGLTIAIGSTGPALVCANASQVTQVVLNLLDNAVNYTTEGGITVTIEPGDTHTTVKVTDTGIGVASEHVGRLFERFYRVDKARSRESGGTGLGLSIVRHLVESNGGRVGVESQLNQGSTFWFTLPTAPEK